MKPKLTTLKKPVFELEGNPAIWVVVEEGLIVAAFYWKFPGTALPDRDWYADEKYVNVP